MNGTCQCGGRIADRSHTVTTERGAKEHGVCGWPAVIEISECKACGRCMTNVFSASRSEAERAAIAEIRAKVDQDKVNK